MKTDLKVCFIASSGGHFEQLMMLKPLMNKFNSFIVTEKTQYRLSDSNSKIYYLPQINRHEVKFPLEFAQCFVASLRILLKENPDVIISTGVLATVPLCLLSKICGKKLIYIESFAKVQSPTLTGRVMYRFADQFYVQWESMKKIYPRAIYLGGIY